MPSNACACISSRFYTFKFVSQCAIDAEREAERNHGSVKTTVQSLEWRKNQESEFLKSLKKHFTLRGREEGERKQKFELSDYRSRFSSRFSSTTGLHFDIISSIEVQGILSSKNLKKNIPTLNAINMIALRFQNIYFWNRQFSRCTFLISEHRGSALPCVKKKKKGKKKQSTLFFKPAACNAADAPIQLKALGSAYTNALFRLVVFL